MQSETIGALPLINHFLSRLGFEKILGRYLSRNRSQHGVDSVVSIGVLLRNIILGREPIYGLKEWASRFTPILLSLTRQQIHLLNDDRIGRALEKLFDADRASLQTELVLKTIHEFQLEVDQLHNDSTSITFSGALKEPEGKVEGGKKTLAIVRGHNKDHRPDLKQLLLILTITADGAIPIHFRLCDGNITDDTTHIETWKTLQKLVNDPNFLYVADCKLCVSETLQYIDKQGGHFITVMPRTRSEYKWFCEYIVDHDLQWEEVRKVPSTCNEENSSEVWRMLESPKLSSEGFRIIWCWSSQKAKHDVKRRQETIKKATLKLEHLNKQLQGKHNRLKSREDVIRAINAVLKRTNTQSFFSFEIQEEKEPYYRQVKRGRPGPNTQYSTHYNRRFSLSFSLLTNVIKKVSFSDGMFPLITNCTELSLKEILEKYKYQPRLEKRFEQLKTNYKIMPVLLKKKTRIESLLFVYFLALLIQTLIEREIRLGMKKAGIKKIPLYHEDRSCDSPTTSRILEIFENLQRHFLLKDNNIVQTFDPLYNSLQIQVLDLLSVPRSVYPGMTKNQEE